MNATPRTTPSAEPCVVVIFGASGDLTQRKLIPALYELFRQKRLPQGLCVLGNSRTEMSDQEWRDHLRPGAEEHAIGFEPGAWSEFAQRLHYLPGSATKPDLYPALIKRVNELAKQHGTVAAECAEDPALSIALPNVLFYLSVAPQLYEPIIDQIGVSGMVFEGKRWCALNPGAVPWQRIIVEKPFGTDLESAVSLNRSLGRVFEEDAIYRIDHYLGKELVQNILVMRFANTIFEPTWNNAFVDHVQVSAIEKVGVGRRAGNFYDEAGAMRDMIQSHLLQVLALVAMEAPSVYDQDAIRREKIKLVSSARLIPVGEAQEHAVFGRYGASGKADDEDEGRAYAELEGVDPERRTETYAAMRVDIDNWRWAGVPFYVRSGKKLARKLTEVVVQFKQPPVNLFRRMEPFVSGGAGALRPANRIIIQIAPGEGVSMRFEAKVPGSSFKLDSVKFEMDYAKAFKAEPIEAYGPLMLDAMRGDQTLYKHRDEIETGWRIVQPVLDSERVRKDIQTYAAGSWGPESADALLARDGRKWHNPA